MTDPRAEIELGDVFDLPYPFASDTYTRHDGDSEGGWTENDVPTWKPGVRFVDETGEGHVKAIADAFGRVVITVVSLHKPGRFPTRVFFTRTWVDPDDKPFGKHKCRITTLSAFRELTHGYRHPFVLADCKCDGCAWPHNDHRLQGAFTTEAPR